MGAKGARVCGEDVSKAAVEELVNAVAATQ
jgi:hypothetical protein